jgi:hypothetical protein
MQPQIAIVNKSSRIADDVLAFAAKALADQVIECALAWNIEPTPVAFYEGEQGLPARDVRIMAIVDDIDVPGAAGYHDFELGVVYARVQGTEDQNALTTCLSHECLEELVDPYCNQWRRMPDGRSTALEACDAVQADAYAMPAIIMKEERRIALSNYLLPKWFDPAATGNFDRMGVLQAPFAMSPGGYLIVRELNGDVINVFARAADARGRLAMASKMERGIESRTARRFMGR